MDLLDLLPPEHVLVPLRARDLTGATLALLRRLGESHAVEGGEEIEARIREEDARDITLTGGAAIQHFRSESVRALTVALGIAPDGLSLEGRGDDRDGGTVRVVALVLAPTEAAALYLQATSTLSRLFRQEGLVDALAGQDDPAGVRALPQLQGLRIQHGLVVRDVMTHRVHSVPPEATVQRTLDLMLRRRAHAVPVVGEKGEVLGMVTDSDIMRALLPKIPRAGGDERDQEDEPRERPVRDIMTRSVLCVSEDLGVSEVASMMVNKDVEQVPVVNSGSIAGMVYRGDIIRKLFGRT